MAQFTLNGKTYHPSELEFKDIRRMEKEFDVSFANMENKTFSSITAFVAMSANVSEEVASQMIQEHVVSGGDFNDIVKAFGDAMKESRFFQAIQKRRDVPALEATETEVVSVQ